MSLKIAILITGGFIVLGLVGLGFLGYYTEKEITPIPESGKPEIKVTSFIGRIIEISDNQIKIQVNQNQNQGIEADGAIIIVKTMENTKYLERETPRFIPEGKSPADLIKQKEISFADLKVGDDIIATASANIAWQKEFMAQSVLRIRLVE